MTSVISSSKQISPYTFYIVENADGYMININFDNFISLDGNTILADMGKTVVKNGFIYRKVQMASYNGELILSSTNNTGYICLNSDRISIDGAGHRNQGVSKMN